MFRNVLGSSWMSPECIMNVTWMYSEFLLECLEMFREVPECIMNIIWMFSECHLNVLAPFGTIQQVLVPFSTTQYRSLLFGTIRYCSILFGSIWNYLKNYLIWICLEFNLNISWMSPECLWIFLKVPKCLLILSWM